jgi:hypothetical protein
LWVLSVDKFDDGKAILRFGRILPVNLSEDFAMCFLSVQFAMRSVGLLVLAASVTLAPILNANGSTGGELIDKQTLANYPFLAGSMKIGMPFGTSGTAYHLGDGFVLSAAHVFTTLPGFSGGVSFSLTLWDGQEIKLQAGQYKLLLDPKSEMDFKYDHSYGVMIQIPRTDVVLLQITDPGVLKLLPPKQTFEVGGAIRSGQQLLGVGLTTNALNSENLLLGTNSTAQPLSISHFQVDEIRYDGKIVTHPLKDSETRPGDSGGPLFVVDKVSGKVNLVAVHHAAIMMRNSETHQNEFSRVALEQKVELSSLKRFVEFGTLEWREKVVRPSAESLPVRNDRFWQTLSEVYISAFTRTQRRSEGLKEMANFLNRTFMWTFSNEEALKVAKKIADQVLKANDKREMGLLHDAFAEYLREPAASSGAKCSALVAH